MLLAGAAGRVLGSEEALEQTLAAAHAGAVISMAVMIVHWPGPAGKTAAWTARALVLGLAAALAAAIAMEEQGREEVVMDLAALASAACETAAMTAAAPFPATLRPVGEPRRKTCATPTGPDTG